MNVNKRSQRSISLDPCGDTLADIKQSFETQVDDLLGSLGQNREDIEGGFDAIGFYVEIEEEWGDVTAFLVANFITPTTDEELKKNMTEDQKHAAQRRRLYEELKKEFGDD